MVMSDVKHDATFAMLFSFPAIDMTSSSADRHICCRNARARSRCPATSDQAVNFVDHRTVAVLSHYIPAHVCFRDGTRCSSTSHSRRTPVISKSLMDSFMLSNCMLMSLGQSTFQNTN